MIMIIRNMRAGIAMRIIIAHKNNVAKRLIIHVVHSWNQLTFERRSEYTVNVDMSFITVISVTYQWHIIYGLYIAVALEYM